MLLGVVCSFSLLQGIPWYEYITAYLFCISIAENFIKKASMNLCIYIFSELKNRHIFSDIYLNGKLLSHWIYMCSGLVSTAEEFPKWLY